MATTLDDDQRELAEAEQRLFAALGIEHRSERLSLTDADDCGVDRTSARSDRCHLGE